MKRSIQDDMNVHLKGHCEVSVPMRQMLMRVFTALVAFHLVCRLGNEDSGIKKVKVKLSL
jgi:hypothetical protein